jgi:protein-S-isoprenylcysteine O-methyltransferase Ste14
VERSILGVTALVVICVRYAPQEVADIRNRSRLVVARASPPVKTWQLLLAWLLIVIPALAATLVAQDAGDVMAFAGFVLLLAGVVLGFLGFRQLGLSYSAELALYSESRLVSKGIYRLIRHPIRLGLALETLGLILVSGQLGLAAIWFLYCWALIRRSQIEDQFLREHSGVAAVQYQETVPAANLFVALMQLRHAFRARSSFARRAT